MFAYYVGILGVFLILKELKASLLHGYSLFDSTAFLKTYQDSYLLGSS